MIEYLNPLEISDLLELLLIIDKVRFDNER